MINVRRAARYVMDYDRWGNDLPADAVDELKTKLIRFLESDGYQRIPYIETQNMETVAYTKDDTNFRQEDILLDDGGSIIPRSEEDVLNLLSHVGTECDEDDPIPLPGDHIFKIAIRNADGKNKELHDTVVQMIREYEASPLRDGASMPVQEGTRVYALKRF